MTLVSSPVQAVIKPLLHCVNMPCGVVQSYTTCQAHHDTQILAVLSAIHCLCSPVGFMSNASSKWLSKYMIIIIFLCQLFCDYRGRYKFGCSSWHHEVAQGIWNTSPWYITPKAWHFNQLSQCKCNVKNRKTSWCHHRVAHFSELNFR